MNSHLVHYERLLKISLPKHQSAFLWGGRKTGKSTFLRAVFAGSAYFNLLDTESYIRYTKEPYKLREEILTLPESTLAKPIIIDEIQKIPMLLDEVHYLIEEKKLQFILCGSSARKLKRGAANLLGGRAWGYHFYPLTSKEITDFNLLKALNNGLLPSHYLSTQYKKSLKSYVNDYLKEEIQAEGLVRNLPSFAYFMDSIAFSNGELTNYTNIASDCGVDRKTVKEYYQILIDTLLGYYIYPFTKKRGRDSISSTPKFYLFDVGVANYLSKKHILDLAGSEAGKSFEHFILMELMAYIGITDKDYKIKFWRTKTGLEVDFIIEDIKLAIEVKISKSIQKDDLKGLLAFKEENPDYKTIIASNDPRSRKIITNDKDEIIIYPYKQFLDLLWSDEVL